MCGGQPAAELRNIGSRFKFPGVRHSGSGGESGQKFDSVTSLHVHLRQAIHFRPSARGAPDRRAEIAHALMNPPFEVVNRAANPARFRQLSSAPGTLAAF